MRRGRTAFGVAFLSWMFLIFAFGAADRIFVAVGLSYNVQLFVFRVGIWVVPAVLYVVTRRWCRALQVAEQVEAIHQRAEQEIRLRQTEVRAQCSSSAWTNAWGRLPRIWRWTTSNSSESSPAGPQAVRLRSNQRTARTASPCWA